MQPTVKCPQCLIETEISLVLTAQSNQNVIFTCPHCHFEMKDIHTSKG